jgi:hypothetical protein
MRPLGSHDWTFNRYMIDMAIVLSLLPLVFETQFGTSGDGVYSSEGWEIGGLLGRLLILWWRWRWVAWLCFGLGYLRACGGVRYLQQWRRVSDCWLGCVDLACMRGVVVWLVVLRRVSMVVGLVFWAGIEMLERRLV